MNTEGDSTLIDRRPPWRWSPRRYDSTTATVPLADRMAVTPTWWTVRASKHTDMVWVKHSIWMILEVYLRQRRRDVDSLLLYAYEG